MIESRLDTTQMILAEPYLADYYRTGTSNYANHITEAWRELIEDLKGKNFDVRKLCKRLSLQTSVTKTAAFTGSKSSEDYAQRNRIVIVVTALTGTAAFTLQGTDDSSSETWTDVSVTLASSAADTAETITGRFTESFKFYRLKQTASITTITYSGYLIEAIYEDLHRLLSLAKVYESLNHVEGDKWREKEEKFRAMYFHRLDNSRFYYDENDDASIGVTEGEADIRQVRFF